MATTLKISHFFPLWHVLKKEEILPAIKEIREGGIEYLTLDERVLLKIVEEPAFGEFFRDTLRQTGMKIFDVHGLCGVKYDLDIDSGKEAVAHMIATHIKCLHYAASLGAKTYTVHMGAVVWNRTPGGLSLEEVRQNTIAAFEKLLPEAEKTGMILCGENSYEPVNTPDEAVFYARYFASPFLGCCFDSGHANMMRKNGKKPEDYSETFRQIIWRNALTFEDAPIEKMAPYIVTCHLHDNNGLEDFHYLPGAGNTQWDSVMEQLKKCPRLVSLQNEGTGFLPGIRCREFEEKLLASPAVRKEYASRIRKIFSILADDSPEKEDALKREMEKI